MCRRRRVFDLALISAYNQVVLDGAAASDSAASVVLYLDSNKFAPPPPVLPFVTWVLGTPNDPVHESLGEVGLV